MISECQYCGRLFGHKDDETRRGCSLAHEMSLRNGTQPTVEDLKGLLRALGEFSQRQAAEIRKRSTREYVEARLAELDGK